MNIVNDTRSTLEKHMPLLLGLLVALLAGKLLKKMFWTAFGMYWALHASGIHLSHSRQFAELIRERSENRHFFFAIHE